MHLYKKQQNFSLFFAPFMKSKSNFKHFQKEDDPHSLCISEITDYKKVG